jgi:hypothetical protein
MQKKTKILAGAGTALALIAAAAGIAVAQHDGGPMSADTNSDGTISAQEIEASARARFAEADANKDGRLTGDEIPHRRGGRGDHGGHGWDGPPAPAQAPQPAQANGQPAPPTVQPAPPVRALLDADADGSVTLPEFYRHMKDRLLRADSNHDGSVTAEELAARRGHHGGR